MRSKHVSDGLGLGWNVDGGRCVVGDGCDGWEVSGGLDESIEGFSDTSSMRYAL